MDDKLTQQIQQWIAAEVKDVPAGAELLLRLNRNRFLYHNILRAPERFADKVEYELKKHLQIRLDGKTMRDVVVMQQALIPAVRHTISTGRTISTDHDGPAPIYSGVRPDHDELPADIQAIPERNKELFYKIKQVYNTLLQMHKSPACDRYEYLKVLKDLDTEYHKNWERYDHATADGAAEGPADAMPAPKEMEAARKYITRNLPQMEHLFAQIPVDEEAVATLRAKMEQRIDVIKRSGGGFSDENRARLLALSFEL